MSESYTACYSIFKTTCNNEYCFFCYCERSVLTYLTYKFFWTKYAENMKIKHNIVSVQHHCDIFRYIILCVLYLIASVAKKCSNFQDILRSCRPIDFAHNFMMFLCRPYHIPVATTHLFDWPKPKTEKQIYKSTRYIRSYSIHTTFNGFS